MDNQDDPQHSTQQASSNTVYRSMTPEVVLDVVVEHEPLQQKDRCSNKRQKKKNTSRPPLCTFFNYLPKPKPVVLVDAPKADAAKAPSGMEGVGVIMTTQTEQLKDPRENRNPLAQDDPEDPAQQPQDLQVAMNKEEKEQTTTTTAAETTLDDDIDDGDDGDDATSVETVNTSNKSVDIYLRDSPDHNHHRNPIIRPAVERWKEPPPPRAPADTLLAELDLHGGLYITSRSESDSESDTEDEAPAKPSEISFQTRGRCPRLQTRWKQHKLKLKQSSYRNSHR